MTLVAQVKTAAAEAISELYGIDVFVEDILVNQTKPEFEGDYTIVLFALTKQLKKSPEVLGREIGDYLVQHYATIFKSYNIIKGFLNLLVTDDYFIDCLFNRTDPTPLHHLGPTVKNIMVEFASPNTNKPLHLGHLRNIFLGWSISKILKAVGNEVMKTSIVNDRGIHICKSMIAWERFGNGETPESTGIKGDHLVGDYYVKFEDELKKQSEPIIERALNGDFSDFDPWNESRLKPTIKLYKAENINNIGKKKQSELLKETWDTIKEISRSVTPIMKEAQQMLLDWEEGKPEVIELWKTMNSWVYAGFDETYNRIGISFDKVYYESETYLLGKKFVEQGLEKGVLYRKEDGSVWIDLTAEGLDEKLLLRKDGTSVYITQDLGLAQQKYEDFPYDESIYVIGDEQNYHMKVLKLILQKLGMPYADGIYHLSYGMVELPSGRMKSREGTVVDADDLIDEMMKIAAYHTQESGKVKDFDADELQELYNIIGLGALKFYLLRVDPKKKMVFNPEESIDFHGFTGPFVQYTHARIKSILRKADVEADTILTTSDHLLPLEKNVLVLLEQYPSIVIQAAAEYNPSVIAIYVYNLAKAFNTFYTEHSVISAETPEKKNLRLAMCTATATIIAASMELLGIKVPERM